MRYIVAVAMLFACTDAPAVMEPEPDCSSPWVQPAYDHPWTWPGRPVPLIRIYESDLPYDLGDAGISVQDRVTVRMARMTANIVGGAWMVALPDDANWHELGHMVEILEASRPGCIEQHAAVLLLFRGEAPE